MNKRGAGLIVGLVIGIAFLIMSAIIAFVIVTNIASVETETASYFTNTITNESGHIGNKSTSSYIVSDYWKPGFSSPLLLKVYNSTSGLPVNIGNFTMNSTGGITNVTEGANETRSPTQLFLITYSYNYYGTTLSTRNLRANLTTGIDNVSSKIPTILLIAAVVLVMGILVLLWTQYQKMSLGGGGTEGSL